MDGLDCRSRRAALGWTETDLANHARVAVATVQNFEGGRTAPRFVTLIALAKALRVAEERQGSSARR